MTQSILVPFNKLLPSRANVRHVKADLAPLVASLRADGLLQNLVVVARGHGRYEVVAGERRRQAAAVLVREGHWAKTRPIPCEVRSPADAVALSIAENIERVAMHPADAYRAFAALAAEGHDATAIAHRYGYAPADVEKLLRLGRLSPRALKALAEDRIDVAFAQALTLTDDPELQALVLKKASTAAEARRLLTATKVTTRHRLYRFVAAEYAAAGGSVTRDLFDAEGEGYADDAELVQRLVDRKLEQLAAAARAEGWREVIAAETEPAEAYRWPRMLPAGEREATETERSATKAAQAELEAREAAVAASDRTDDDRAYLAERRRRIAEIERGRRFFTDKQKAEGALLISIDYEGGVRTTAHGRANERAERARAAAGEKPLYPAALIEDLSKLRTRALQLELARAPALALDLLLDALLTLRTGAARHAIQLRAEGFRLEGGEDIAEAPIAEPETAAAELLAAMPAEPAARWSWLAALAADDKQRLLACATARLLNGIVGRFAEPERLAAFERAAAAAGLDMSAHWRPGASFFARLTKRACLAALEEGAGREVALNCAKLKKAALAEACAERLAGSGWLPQPLRAPPAGRDAESSAAPEAPALAA